MVRSTAIAAQEVSEADLDERSSARAARNRLIQSARTVAQDAAEISQLISSQVADAAPGVHRTYFQIKRVDRIVF